MLVQVSFPVEAICIRTLHCPNCLRSNRIAFGRTTACSDLGHGAGNHSAEQNQPCMALRTLYQGLLPVEAHPQVTGQTKRRRLPSESSQYPQLGEAVHQSDLSLCQTELPVELLKDKGCLNRNSAWMMKPWRTCVAQTIWPSHVDDTTQLAAQPDMLAQLLVAGKFKPAAADHHKGA